MGNLGVENRSTMDIKLVTEGCRVLTEIVENLDDSVLFQDLTS
jgi:hypothetical protein